MKHRLRNTKLALATVALALVGLTAAATATPAAHAGPQAYIGSHSTGAGAGPRLVAAIDAFIGSQSGGPVHGSLNWG